MEIIDFVTLPDGEIDFEGKAKELLQFKGTKKDIAKKVEELKIRYAEQKPYVESNQLIENTIYGEYSKDKQSQDEKWTSSFTTKLKAAGIQNLEELVVDAVRSYLPDNPVDRLAADIIATFDSNIIGKVQGESEAEKTSYATKMVEKLIKIAVRTEWAEQCIIIGKAALASNSKPEFPTFPEL